MSEQPFRSPILRRWVLIVYWVVMFVGTHWPEIERYGPERFWRIPHSDKLAHAGLYAVWTAIWWWLLSAGGRRVAETAVNWLVLGGAVYAIFDEATQAIVARDPSIYDFVADMVGLLMVVSILSLWQRRR